VAVVALQSGDLPHHEQDPRGHGRIPGQPARSRRLGTPRASRALGVFFPLRHPEIEAAIAATPSAFLNRDRGRRHLKGRSSLAGKPYAHQRDDGGREKLNKRYEFLAHHVALLIAAYHVAEGRCVGGS
jgi:hypothetical protein